MKPSPVRAFLTLCLMLSFFSPAPGQEVNDENRTDLEWSAPIYAADPACVGEIHLYFENSGPVRRYLRAEAQETLCKRPSASSLPSARPPAHRPAAGTLRKSAWIWEEARWRKNPEFLLKTGRDGGYDRFWIGVAIDGGAVSHPEALAGFIAKAEKAGLVIGVVEGDPEMISRKGLTYATRRAKALAAFNNAHPKTTIKHLQYDIEPYLLQRYVRDPSGTAMAWAESLVSLSAAYGSRVDVVIPFWLLETPGGRAALDAAEPYMSGLTVMAYRTGAEEIASVARAGLQWAEPRGVPGEIALENAPVPDEHIRIYRRAQKGELALLFSAEERCVQLYKQPRSNAAQLLFRYSHTVTAPASRVSFLGNEAALEGAIAHVIPRLSVYDSLQGFAVHGAAISAGDQPED